MAIDISKFNAGAAAQVRSNSTKQSSESEKTSQVAAKSTQLKGDSVVITAQAQQLQGAQTKMASLPEVDQKKVAEINKPLPKVVIKLIPKSWLRILPASKQN